MEANTAVEDLRRVQIIHGERITRVETQQDDIKNDITEIKDGQRALRTGLLTASVGFFSLAASIIFAVLSHT